MKSRLRELDLMPASLVPRDDMLFKNSHWYDQSLSRIASGDISQSHPQQIAQKLYPGELFLILQSHQRNTENIDQKLDIRFAVQSFGMLIVPRCVFLPGVDGGIASKRTATEYPTLSPDTAKRLITSINRQ